MGESLCLIATFLIASTAVHDVSAEVCRPASVVETEIELKTYPFSDPDPVPATSLTRYPYFFIDGTSEKGEMKKWKAVILETEHVKVTMLP